MGFFGSMKDEGIFWVVKKKTGIFFGYCTFHQLKSTITLAQFTAGVGFFLGMLKMQGFFG